MQNLYKMFFFHCFSLFFIVIWKILLIFVVEMIKY